MKGRKERGKEGKKRGGRTGVWVSEIGKKNVCWEKSGKLRQKKRERERRKRGGEGGGERG